MLKKEFLILIFFFTLLLPLQKAHAQQSDQTAKTIVGTVAPEETRRPGDFVFYCQYGKVDEKGAMAPGGDGFWNQNGCDIYGSGCGPTGIAMIVSSFGKTKTPIEVASAIPSNVYSAGIGCKAGGTYIPTDFEPGIRNWLDKNGFTMTGNMVDYSTRNIDLTQVRDYLKRGYYIAAGADVQYVDRGGYSNDFAGHFFVITGINSDNSLDVMDPTFCRLQYIGGVRKLTNVNDSSLRGRTNVSRWIGAYGIKPKNK